MPSPSVREGPRGALEHATYFASWAHAICVRVRAHVFFEGLVQGVFFRANTQRCAEELGVTGWVRNTSDGRVEAVFEGEEGIVNEAIDWCATRQPYAQVRSKDVELSEFKGEFDMFSILQ